VSPARWAISPLDSDVHLLLDPDGPRGEVRARCGQLLPTDTQVHDQPPPGPPCESCRVIYLADCAFTQQQASAN
jgi:hypothetical protein